MYAWIWRHLPFGLYGKLAGSAALALAVTALLWYVAFPWLEPLLPFDDVQVETGAGEPGGPAGEPGAPTDGSPAPGDGFDVPYSEESNAPAPPSATPRRR